MATTRLRWRRYWAFFSFAVFLLLVLALASQFRSTALRISEETTLITKPLKSDGQQVDYFAALEQETYPENLATDENGYRLVLDRLGPSSETEPWQFEQLCEKLGLSSSEVRQDMTYQEPYDFMTACVGSSQFDEAEKAIVARLRARYRPETRQSNASDHAPPLVENEPLNDSADEVAAEPSIMPFESTWNGESRDEARMLLWQALDGPWTLDDLPMMQRWLEENSPALDFVGEAVRKPSFHVPLVRQSENDKLLTVELPEVIRTRSFARGLCTRARYRIATGDLDGAIDDIVACQRLACHVGRGATLNDMLIGMACEGLANSIGLAGSPDHPPTREQLQRLLDALDDLPPRAEFLKKMRYERFTALDLVQSLAHGGDAAKAAQSYLDPPPAIGLLLMVAGFDWNVVARQVNAHYDAIIDHGVYPTAPDFRPSLIVSRSARSQLLADDFAALLTSSNVSAEMAGHRARCSGNLKRITLAMLLYERDHGTLPPAWTVDSDGRPLHSWRALLLPYLGHRELYEQIRLDEPWDSVHNATLHQADVPCYQCSAASLGRGRTTYGVVIGEKEAFDGSGQGRPLDALGLPGASMILLVERQNNVCWMDPGGNVDYRIARRGINVTPDGIGSHHAIGAFVGLHSGAVTFLNDSMDVPSCLRGLIEGTWELPPP